MPARHRHHEAAEDDDPENALLAGVETLGRRMGPLHEQAAARLEPFHIETVGDVVLHPDEEHQRDARHEREGQIIVRDLAPGREIGESGVAKQRRDDALAIGQVEARQRQDDEGRGRHPVHEAVEAAEARDGAAGEAAVDLDAAAHEVEHHKQAQHAEHGERADQRQRALMERAPGLALRLDQRARVLVGDGDASAHRRAGLERVEQLLLLHRLRGGIGSLLRGSRGGGADRPRSETHEQRKSAGAEKVEGRFHRLALCFRLNRQSARGPQRPRAFTRRQSATPSL